MSWVKNDPIDHIWWEDNTGKAVIKKGKLIRKEKKN